MDLLIQSSHLWLPGSIAMFALILASGFFSASETALFYLSHDELREMRSGKPREQNVILLLSDPDRLLTAVLFWNLIINLTYFSCSGVVVHNLVSSAFPVSAALFGAGSLLAMILLGEVLPKSMAVTNRRWLSALVSWPLALAIRVIDPVTPLLRKTTELLRRTFWPHLKKEESLNAEDLEKAVEASQRSAEVVNQERDVLHNILDLSEMTVEEVMRPRGSYVSKMELNNWTALDGEVPHCQYISLQNNEEGNVDSVIALNEVRDNGPAEIERVTEKVLHLPWCANLAYALGLMREQFCSVAEILNEYGESIGIVTYEDIVDTLLTPEPSRAKRVLRREPVLEIAEGKYHVDGMTTLRYLCRRLGLDYEPSTDGLLTVAGLMHDQLEHVPVSGDECSWNQFRFRVIDASTRGQFRVMVSRQYSDSEEKDA